MLRHGIRIEHLELAGVQVERLYLKLDKRLIVKARSVVLPSQREELKGSEALRKGLTRLHQGLRLLQSVDLERVVYRGKRYRILYRDGILYLDSPDYEIAGMVYNRGNDLELQFPLVRLRRYDVTLSGELSYRYADGRLVASGFYNVPDLSGEFSVTREGEEVRFRLDSMRTASLERLLNLFNMSREAKEWLSRRISAKSYRLVSLEGRGRYDAEAGNFVPDFRSLSGVVRLEKVRIRFNDKLLPLTARSARVLLRDGNLYFLLDRPRYGRRDLSGSQAALLNLDDPDRLTLLLRLYYRGRVDWQVLRILQAYGLHITLGQKEGRTRARVDLDVPLGKKGRVKVRGIARFGRGVLELKKRTIPIEGGEIAFTSRELALRDLKLRLPSFRGSVTGRADLRRRTADLELKVRRFEFAVGGETLLRICRKRFPLKLRWSERGARVVLPSLQSRLQLSDKGSWRFTAKKLSLWLPYLQQVRGFVREGEIRADRDEGGAYRLSGTLLWPDAPFYTREGTVTRFPFEARVVGSALRFDALGGRIAFRSGQKLLRIEGLNVDARRLLETMQRRKQASKLSRRSSMRLTILGSKSVIRYGRYVLLSDAYRLEIDGENLRFDGVLGNDHLHIEKKGPMLSAEAKRIDDRMLHALIHFNGLQGGRYTLHLEGSEAKGYTGEILIEGGVLRDVKVYNDMIALFNTLPALVSFSSPGFSKKGFEIRKGRILFTLKGETLTLESIVLEGRSATVAGKGTVLLKNGALAVDLAIQTAREVGRTVGKIPVVGYILFGKDKSLTVGVRITGTLRSPHVQTNPVGEALLYPLELIKRTLMAPMEMGRYDESPGPNVRRPAPEPPRTGNDHNETMQKK